MKQSGIHNMYWRNMSNLLYTENGIQRTKLRILQKEPAEKFICFFFFFFYECELINTVNRTLVNFKNFSWGLSYRSLSRIELNRFKNRLRTCGFADWIFFLIKCYPERISSSLKKTIVLYLVKKFETLVVIFTSGEKRVFFEWTNFWYIGFSENPF